MKKKGTHHFLKVDFTKAFPSLAVFFRVYA